MLLSELFKRTIITERVKIAYARTGDKVVKKYRCTSGSRQGRIVNNPSDCNKPFDLKKRIKFKQTKLAKGTRINRRAQRTKKRNPASLRLQRMNKALNR